MNQYLNAAALIFVVCSLARVVFSIVQVRNYCHYVGLFVKIEEIIIAIFSLFLFVKVAQIIFFKSKMFLFVLSFDKLKWIKQFLFLGGGVLFFWVIAIVYNLKNIEQFNVYIYYPLRISSTLLLYWVSYYGCFKTALLADRIVIRDINKKINFSRLDLPVNDSIFMIQIIDYTLTSKCYLNAFITIDKFALALNTDKKIVSKEINLSRFDNFNDLMNFYRIQTVKTLLLKPESSKITNESIGYECGFNSKSAFYDAFKKYTKLSPSAFRSGQ